MIDKYRGQMGLVGDCAYLGLEDLAIWTKTDIGQVNCWVRSIGGRLNKDYEYSGTIWLSRDDPLSLLKHLFG